MILSVDPERALPVYEQVREQIRRMVAAGTLTPGTRLPTIRQLASDLGRTKAQPCVVAPVAIRQRVVLIFYGDRGGEDLVGTDEGQVPGRVIRQPAHPGQYQRRVALELEREARGQLRQRNLHRDPPFCASSCTSRLVWRSAKMLRKLRR